jgi:phosphatidylserine decarboxylase
MNVFQNSSTLSTISLPKIKNNARPVDTTATITASQADGKILSMPILATVILSSKDTV